MSDQGFHATDHTAEFDSADIEANKTVSALAYLGILFFLPLAACPSSRFGRFHANQAFLLFICSAIISSSGFMIRSLIPIFGPLYQNGLNLAIFVIMVLKLVEAVQGNAKELPIIGGITIIK